MQVQQFEEDVEIISKLGDDPNIDDGLSADDLKAKFDEASRRIKAYLNGTVVPALNGRPTNPEVSELLEEIRADIADVENDLVDISNRLSAEMSVISDQYEVVDGEMEAVSTDLEKLKTDLSALSQKVDEVNSDVNYCHDRIDGIIDGDIFDINEDLDGVHKDINSINANLAKVSSDVRNNSQTIDEILADIENLGALASAQPLFAGKPTVGQIFQISAVDATTGRVTVKPVDMPSGPDVQTMTQADYDSIATHTPGTIYLIVEE